MPRELVLDWSPEQMEKFFSALCESIKGILNHPEAPVLDDPVRAEIFRYALLMSFMDKVTEGYFPDLLRTLPEQERELMQADIHMFFDLASTILDDLAFGPSVLH